MQTYYETAPAPETTDRHRLLVRLWDADGPAFDASVLTPGFGTHHVDEIKLNRPNLSALSHVPAPGQLDWLYVDGGSYQRPDGTLWTPAVNSDATNLETKADADEARLNEIRDLGGNPDATLTDVRRAVGDLAGIVERIHRTVLRQMDELQ
jgi:hypothetical protein